MAININQLNTGQNSQQVANNKAEQKQAQQQNVQQQSQQAPSAPRQDSVSLTPNAQQLTKLQQKANDAPTVNQEKVANIKKAIAEGNYSINPERLAAKIAQFEKDLFE
ncbi:flagellar biosynthesis anti-sigma factor FlgM [Algicola sagamiensis]|uniref:flagellar biosynthesis anti-sigma factor FlgM n=1 Tax=Algicola sagamiensis TaxID=163869 RepID=UPI000364A83F|nr:flagellar biosynthesis anti-sigma factor FlgM [Algicola sagamiensis]